MVGQPAVASVGTTPAAVLVPASTPAPGLPARSNTLNQDAAIDDRTAVLATDRYCLAAAMAWSNEAMAMSYPNTTTLKALAAGAAAKVRVTRFTDGRVTSHRTLS